MPIRLDFSSNALIFFRVTLVDKTSVVYLCHDL